ncbi:polysaccharide deacetylase family protein [Pyxidicoccus fallax]|uniref:Polysaccharide deacetylase family protein n=1 Tax=Pyxidicoccus fallax TaxID=394095 RepID=A0A848LEQ8_9BACT|nr:polysaccharide deacetylase family protein [Pyxidicoccus fallax]NMO16966.1 polysaccharide deacetylase family protein [Pyxidicoccus fallax]NPC82750.1 polysaccharide deacetylase family protein [Pyxidicoccus fallax]
MNTTTRALAPGQVLVSLNFDDGLASQLQAAAILEVRGMRGTFFINSGRLGQSGRLTLAQVRALQDAGHEIGGHTLTHPRLTTLSADDQRREICNDRVALLNAGLRVTSFAYPFGDKDSVTRQIVIDCNYNSARESGGLRTPTGGSSNPYAETVPPADAYAIRTHGSLQDTTTLDTMKAYVTQAENSGGGWVPIVFHHICGPCDPPQTYSTSPAVLTAFLDWLAPRASRGTTVALMDTVIGGTLKPPVSWPPTQSQLFKNPSLESDSNGDGTPDCWQRGGFGTNTFTWARTSDAHSGGWAQRVSITSISSGDRKLISLQDSGTCSPAATAGHRYRISAWYKSNVPVRFKAYYRDSAGVWDYWTQGPLLPAVSSYTRAEWTTPGAPSAARRLSLGLSLDRVGTLTMDDFSLTDIDATATLREGYARVEAEEEEVGVPASP